MSKVKNQHYIPQSYLRGFGIQKKKEWYVYSRINNENIFPINVKNICAERYLYDLPELGEEREQLIEKFYAEHVDGSFTEILEFAKDEENIVLPEELRAKIISSCVSLVFRTPKFLNNDADQIKLYTDIPGEGIDEKRKRKIIALQNHFQKSIELIKLKYNDGIAINRVAKDMQFITCDNPVIIRNQKGEFKNYYDPKNIFHVPISPEFSITITPSIQSDLKGTFARYSQNKAGVLCINHDIQKSHEQFLIGADNGIEEFLADMAIYNTPTPEAHQMLDDQIKIKQIIEHVLSVLENQKPAEFIKILKKYWDEESVVRSDDNYINYMKKFKLI